MNGMEWLTAAEVERRCDVSTSASSGLMTVSLSQANKITA